MKNSWKIISSIISSAFITISAILPAEARPQLTGMTNAQRTSLKSLGMKIVVPGYVPEGFRVIGITTDPLREGRSKIGRPAYSIIYRSPSNSCFQISGTSGGVGGPGGEYQVPVTSQLLGTESLYFNTRPGTPSGNLTPSPALLKAPQSYLRTDWFKHSSPVETFYSLNSPLTLRPTIGTPSCKASSITPQEAIKIVDALEWLP